MLSIEQVLAPHTPKLGPTSPTSRAGWYPYYAGYSPQFVSDVIDRLNLRHPTAVVLDPWNGSGTTTSVCSQLGVPSIGYDANPVMVIVAKARLLDRHMADSLKPLLNAVLDLSATYKVGGGHDPLMSWFSNGTAKRIRAIQRSVLTLLTTAGEVTLPSQVSSVAAFFHVLLFRLVRSATAKLGSTNPTWIKARIHPDSKVRLTFRQLRELLSRDLDHISLLDRDSGTPNARAIVDLADSRSLPIERCTVDAVITSPPYCTRIDYAVATRMELAVLGIDDSRTENLRRLMIGTTLTGSVQDGELGGLPKSVADLLASIKAHQSKASGTYYFRSFLDYFIKLDRSYAEISRVLKVGGSAAIVVQDSAYKEIEIDLAGLSIDMLRDKGLALRNRWDYACERSMRDRGRLRRREKKPVESALVFSKEEAYG